jgi:hypothetical protein
MAVPGPHAANDIPVVIVTEAEPDDIRDARASKRLWKYSPDRGHRAFGMTLSAFHLTCVMIVGVLTVALHTGRALAGDVPSLAPQPGEPARIVTTCALPCGPA